MAKPTYAIVRILHDEGKRWIPLTLEYLKHVGTYMARSTIYNVEKPAIKSFTNFIGNLKLSQITKEKCEEYCNLTRLRLKQGSARTNILAVRVIFSYAVDRGWIFLNPFRGIILPKQEFAGRVLSDKELRLFLSKLKPIVRRVYVFALYTGMRPGEVCSLEWSQVGLNEEVITITTEKSKSRRARVLPVCAEARALLPPRDGGKVFKIGRYKISSDITRAWRECGIGRIRFHDARHTWATKFYELTKDLYALLYAGGWVNANSAKPYIHSTGNMNANVKYNL